MNELVSIVIPIYNVENYLEKCLDSVIHQSYSNIEIILINDASPDNSIEICEKFQNIDPRIIVVNKTNNEGISAARNTGLDICKGQYITFIDGDDYIAEKYIEILYNGIKQEKAKIAVGNIKKTDIHTVHNLDYNLHEKTFLNISSYDAVKNMYSKEEDIFNLYVLVTGKLYDKSLFENLRFPIGKVHEDEFLNYRLYFLAVNIAYCKIDLYYYVQRANSFTSTKYTIDKISKIESLEERCIFFRELALEELYKYSIYALYCQILFNIYSVKKYYPEAHQIIFELNKKLKVVKNEINKKSNLSIKSKIIVNVYYYFRFVFQLKNLKSI